MAAREINTRLRGPMLQRLPCYYSNKIHRLQDVRPDMNGTDS